MAKQLLYTTAEDKVTHELTSDDAGFLLVVSSRGFIWKEDRAGIYVTTLLSDDIAEAYHAVYFPRGNMFWIIGVAGYIGKGAIHSIPGDILACSKEFAIYDFMEKLLLRKGCKPQPSDDERMDADNVKDVKAHSPGTKPIDGLLPPPKAPVPEKVPVETTPYYHFDWRDYRADDDPPGFNKFITDAVATEDGLIVHFQAIINRRTKTITVFPKKNSTLKTTYSLHGFGNEYDSIETLGNNWLNDNKFKPEGVFYIAPKRKW